MNYSTIEQTMGIDRNIIGDMAVAVLTDTVAVVAYIVFDSGGNDDWSLDAAVIDLDGGVTVNTPVELVSNYVDTVFIGSWNVDMCRLTDTTALIAYCTDNETGSSEDRIRAGVITVSGTTLSMGSTTVITGPDALAAWEPRVEAIDATNAVIIWKYGSAGAQKGKVDGAVLNISGTTVTKNSTVNIQAGSASTEVYNPDLTLLGTDTMVASWEDDEGPYGCYRILYDITSSTFSVGDRYIQSIEISTKTGPRTVRISDTVFVSTYIRWESTVYYTQMACYIAITSSPSTLTIYDSTETIIGSEGDDYETFAVDAVRINNMPVFGHVLSQGPGETNDEPTIRGGSISGTTVVADVTEYKTTTLVDETSVIGDSNNSVALFAYERGDYDGGSVADILLVKVSLANARFYTGTSALTERSTMNITDIERSGLLVRESDNGSTVVAASAESNDTVVVEQATGADVYATWTDITGTHPQGRVTSIKEI